MDRQRLLLSLIALAALTMAVVAAGSMPARACNLAAGDKIREELKKSTGGEAAPAEEEAVGGTASGWGTLSGVFLFDGVVPLSPAPIVPDKDAEVCGKHPMFDESITVGPGGGLENMVICLRNAEDARQSQVRRPGRQGNRAGQQGLPLPAARRAGTDQRDAKDQELRSGWPQQQAGAVQDPAFNSLIPTGQAADIHLTNEETLPVKLGLCIDPWMGSRIVARSDPMPRSATRMAISPSLICRPARKSSSNCGRKRSVVSKRSKSKGSRSTPRGDSSCAFARRGQEADVQGFAEITHAAHGR